MTRPESLIGWHPTDQIVCDRECLDTLWPSRCRSVRPGVHIHRGLCSRRVHIHIHRVRAAGSRCSACAPFAVRLGEVPQLPSGNFVLAARKFGLRGQYTMKRVQQCSCKGCEAAQRAAEACVGKSSRSCRSDEKRLWLRRWWTGGVGRKGQTIEDLGILHHGKIRASGDGVARH
jgi:hypothetical protein